MHYSSIVFENNWIFGRNKEYVVETFRPLNLCKNFKSRQYNRAKQTSETLQHNESYFLIHAHMAKHDDKQSSNKITNNKITTIGKQ